MNKQDPQSLQEAAWSPFAILESVEALIACGGCLMVAGLHLYQKWLVVGLLDRQQKILYHVESRSIPNAYR